MPGRYKRTCEARRPDDSKLGARHDQFRACRSMSEDRRSAALGSGDQRVKRRIIASLAIRKTSPTTEKPTGLIGDARAWRENREPPPPRSANHEGQSLPRTAIAFRVTPHSRRSASRSNVLRCPDRHRSRPWRDEARDWVMPCSGFNSAGHASDRRPARAENDMCRRRIRAVLSAPAACTAPADRRIPFRALQQPEDINVSKFGGPALADPSSGIHAEPKRHMRMEIVRTSLFQRTDMQGARAITARTLAESCNS